jgi:hypothetical protein
MLPCLTVCRHNRACLGGDDADTSQRRTGYDKVIDRPLGGKDEALHSTVLNVIRESSVYELPVIESVRRTLKPSVYHAASERRSPHTMHV